MLGCGAWLVPLGQLGPVPVTPPRPLPIAVEPPIPPPATAPTSRCRRVQNCLARSAALPRTSRHTQPVSVASRLITTVSAQSFAKYYYPLTTRLSGDNREFFNMGYE